MNPGDYSYGNVRLRARALELLAAAELQQLATLDLAGVSAALAATPYAPALSAALSEQGLLAAVHTTAADRRRRARRFYSGRAGNVLDLLLARHDRTALVGLLRAARDAPAQAIDAVLPSNRMPEPLLRIAATAPDLPAVVDLLARRGAPNPGTAAAVRRALRDYELRNDWAAFETAAVQAHAAAVAAQAAAVRPGPSVQWLLATDVDLVNLLAVVRAGRDDRAAGDIAFLSGGRLSGRMLARLARSADPDGLAAVLGRARPEWSAALTAWAGHTDPVRLQDDLEAGTRFQLRRRWRSGDPLGPDVPAGYLAAVDAEAHTLALIVGAAGGRLKAHAALQRLPA